MVNATYCIQEATNHGHLRCVLQYWQQRYFTTCGSGLVQFQLNQTTLSSLVACLASPISAMGYAKFTHLENRNN